MKPFLRETAEDLYRIFGERMQDICLVFPNRRAGLFFNKYLGETISRPLWSPSIYTIQDLMARISDLEYADELELISILYGVYSRERGMEDSFDEFLFWGEVMLSDFDEVDKYLVNAGDIFQNLADLKDLEGTFQYLSPRQIELIRRFWSTFSYDQLSGQKQQFLEIWNILYPVYREFRKKLVELGLGYEGMIYRHVAENLKQGNLPDPGFTRIVFIGFNALSPSERDLFEFFRDSAKGMFYWDYDEYYLEREVHEAGHFIRENLSRFRDSGTAFNHRNLVVTDAEIRVYSVPSDTGQAQLLHSILADAGAGSGEETAIVLADEELLIPVLNSLPPTLEEINVTMGYPVNGTPVFSLIEHLIGLQRNLRESGPSGTRFYYLDVLPLLQHQYVMLQRGEEARDLVRSIHEQNLIYLPAERLAGNEVFRQIFRKISNPEEIADYLLAVLEMITGAGDADNRTVPALELEFIFRIYTRIKRLRDVLERLGRNFSLSTFLRLFHKFLQRTRIPFSGEPLAGVQVMGILETRVLDFDRVIILNMNEGAFPGKGAVQSFIPYHLRLGFRLPTVETQDAIYAYYFYRLIQRSGEIHLIYNNKTEGLTTGEKSRYIYQLQYDPAFRSEERSAGFDLRSVSPLPITVQKTPEVLRKLDRYLPSRGGAAYLSPSALNIFIDCPLQFYFNYVAGIREPTELKEEVDSALFGTLLHEAVRTLYATIGNPVSKEAIRSVLKAPEKIRNAVDGAFSRVYFQEKESQPLGRNRVIREILFTYAERILEKDLEYCPFRIQSLEESYSMEMPVPLQNGSTVRIGGKIDRIDRLADSYRVLDYKTGQGKLGFRSLEDLFNPENENRNRAAFQTLLYARLFSQVMPEEGIPVTPGVYLIREIFSGDFRYHFTMGEGKAAGPVLNYSDLEEDFTSNLSELVGRIFDPGSAFTQTDQVSVCRNCPYRGICQR